MADLIDLPLKDLHAEMGAKFVPFAGYEMPVQYAAGVMSEHLWTREKAGLFDVSHMGQVLLPSGQDTALEALVPVDVLGLAVGRQRYGLFTTDSGGVIDDLMIARRAEDLFLVVNASRKADDLAHLRAHLSGVVEVTDRALLALQGPLAETALARLLPVVAEMRFMDVLRADWEGSELWVSRSGYAGEDGFEISVPAAGVDAFARALLAMEEVAPVGLGARDSLRLEAGLPLYGNDLSEEISPIEAGMSWAISKARRAGEERALGYPGADRIEAERSTGAARKRIGLVPEGRAPMRGGVALFDAEKDGSQIGIVTSGGFGPSVGHPIAMALVDAGLAPEAIIYGEVRGKRLPAKQVPLPFHKATYKR